MGVNESKESRMISAFLSWANGKMVIPSTEKTESISRRAD